MPKPRFSGGSVSMRVSSSQIVPPDSGSRPAMQLSAVDLPQPDGPSSAMNSPRSMVSVSSLSALNAWPPAPAKRRVTPVEPQLVESRASCRWMRARRARRRAATWRTVYFVFCAPTCWSQIRNASTCALGGSDCVCGNCVEPAFVFRTAELLDRVLALLRRHRQRHVLHRRARIEVALVVGVRLRFGVSMYAIRSSTTASFSGGTPFGITM